LTGSNRRIGDIILKTVIDYLLNNLSTTLSAQLGDNGSQNVTMTTFTHLIKNEFVKETYLKVVENQVSSLQMGRYIIT
jgi:hypothetical protein